MTYSQYVRFEQLHAYEAAGILTNHEAAELQALRSAAISRMIAN